jgi:hypothetical protein
MKTYYIKSHKNKWLIWLTTNMSQKGHERYRDTANNFPIIIPPTDGDRIDIHSGSHKFVKTPYQYGVKGCVIIIKNGEIIDLVYDTRGEH